MPSEDTREAVRAARWQAVADGALDRRVAEWMDDRDRFAEQDENGVDLSLIVENLKLSPLERVRKGDAAARSAAWILETARRVPATSH